MVGTSLIALAAIVTGIIVGTGYAENIVKPPMSLFRAAGCGYTLQ